MWSRDSVASCTDVTVGRSLVFLLASVKKALWNFFCTFMLHTTAECLPPMPMQTSPEGETLLIRTLAAIHASNG